MITFMVNSGIGDLSWLYSKLDEFTETNEVRFLVAMDKRERARPFIEMHPRIKSEGYGNFGDHIPMKHTIDGNTDLKTLEQKAYPLSINKWLIDGKKLKDWLPNEPTNYKYNLDFTISDKENAKKLMSKNINIGLYGSSYSTLRQWNFWKEDLWMDLVHTISKIYPEVTFYVIGASFDIDLGDNLYKTLLAKNIKAVKVIGETLGLALSVIKNLDYFFSFPSGLGIVANVLNTPTMMFLPPHLEQMKYNFTPDEDNENGFFINTKFISPTEAFELFFENGKQHMEKRISNKIL